MDRTRIAGGTTLLVRLVDSSSVGEARRRATDLARGVGFDATLCGQIAIAVTEAATNVIKHAQGGQLLFNVRQALTGVPGLEVLVLDRGSGIDDLRRAMRDGYSTTETPGTGLGAMRRLTREFDVYTVAGAGTVLRLWFASSNSASLIGLGAISVPKRGEEVCGDGWAVRGTGDDWRILVSDGLGHGPDAARASRLASESFLSVPEWPGCEAWLAQAHGVLRRTRGAALGVAELDFAGQCVPFAGVGNIAATVVSGSDIRHLVSHNGIVGHEVRKIQAFDQLAPPEAVVVMHSDGLSSRWDFNAYPGLLGRHPAVIAAVLYRDRARDGDDATVVITKTPPVTQGVGTAP